jgi:hypothetical protein
LAPVHNREPHESMSQLGRTRLQTKRAREQNESAEAEVSMNADMFASLRACDCVAAAGHLCDKDHQYLREFSLLAANFADSSENKSAHLVSHGDEWLALKCVTIDNNDDDDAKGNQEWNANKKLASLLEQSVCGGFAAPVAYMCERKSRRVKRWFLFGFAGASLSFVNALIPLFQVATIGQIRTAEDHVRLLRVQRSLRRERAILTIYCKYDVDNAVVSVNERNQIVDALCGMPELESARTFVRSAFDAARALASDERVARGAILQIVYSLVCAEEQHQLVHDDLHANNICLQPCGVWQVLFDDDQVAYFIPPGVRAFATLATVILS